MPFSTLGKLRGVPGTPGGPETSTSMRPSTRRVDPSGESSTSLITTRKANLPLTSWPARRVTLDWPLMLGATPDPVTVSIETTVGVGSETPDSRYGARSISSDWPACSSSSRIGSSRGGGALSSRKLMSAGLLSPAVTVRVASPPRLASSAAVTWNTGPPSPETASPSSCWLKVAS